MQKLVAMCASAWAMVIIVGLLMWSCGAWGAGLGDWYKSLRVPNTGISCCDVSDCGPIEADAWRTTDVGYEVRIADNWILVPEERVLNRADNPTGRAVLCSMYGRVLCFLPGTLS